MSPQSRRRYQSRMSSARLRERQRQRIVDAEEEVKRLEAYVRSLQSSIDLHYQNRMQSTQENNERTSMNNGVGQELNKEPLYGLEDIGDIRKTLEEFLQRKDELAIARDSTLANNMQLAEQSGSLSESGHNSDQQIPHLIRSMSTTVDHLQQCVRRIDVLKEMISNRVNLLEHGIIQPSAPQAEGSRSSLGEDTLQNNTETSSGSGKNSTIGIRYRAKTDKQNENSEQPSSRFSISFLLDKD
ncbi:hypothetical protein IWW36_004916 [Coemansia brasiliensis]|uniref:BZIP domain-containing protein n=1 Tax=Coemansia brasiliensis TaxID=2650707 RepID=A0A9W8I409_9FUNG|nr:hypothetical protein IWW36_004916 [Coemansia brasiliensis]